MNMNAQKWCFGGKYALGSGWAGNPAGITLQEWADSIGEIVQTHASGSKYIVTDKLDCSQAFHLSDYLVTSRCGIVLWFAPR